MDLVPLLRDLAYSRRIAHKTNETLGREKMRLYRILVRDGSPDARKRFAMIVKKQMAYFSELNRHLVDRQFSDFIVEHFAEANSLCDDAREELIWLIAALRTQARELEEEGQGFDALRGAMKEELSRYKNLSSIVNRGKHIIDQEAKREWRYENENLPGIIVSSTFFAAVFGIFVPDIFSSVETFVATTAALVALKHVKYAAEHLSRKYSLKQADSLMDGRL